MLRVVSAPPFGIRLRNVLPGTTRVSARVEQVRELRELRFNSGNYISVKVARDFR
jgi:hypothetical protein